MSLTYNPADWYWIVGGDGSRLWSSKRAAYVPAADATLAAWHDAGGLATRIGSEAELADVLATQYPPGRPGPRYVPLAAIRERVTSAGKWPQFCSALDALPAVQRWHLLTLAEGVAPDDADAVALLRALDLDPAVVLA